MSYEFYADSFYTEPHIKNQITYKQYLPSSQINIQIITKKKKYIFKNIRQINIKSIMNPLKHNKRHHG